MLAALSLRKQPIKVPNLKPLKRFCSLLTSTWKEFYQNGQYWKHICYRTIKYTAWRHVCVLFSVQKFHRPWQWRGYKLAESIFALAVFVWETPPCSTLLTSDENAVTVSSLHSVFQLVPVSNSSYKELLYCSAVLSGILKPQVLQISCLVTVLSESQPLKVVGWILLQFLSAGIGKFSGGMAGMWPSTVLERVVSHCCFLQELQ